MYFLFIRLLCTRAHPGATDFWGVLPKRYEKRQKNAFFKFWLICIIDASPTQMHYTSRCTEPVLTFSHFIVLIIWRSYHEKINSTVLLMPTDLTVEVKSATFHTNAHIPQFSLQRVIVLRTAIMAYLEAHLEEMQHFPAKHGLGNHASPDHMHRTIFDILIISKVLSLLLNETTTITNWAIENETRPY